jgi:alpha-galactosidase
MTTPPPPTATHQRHSRHDVTESDTPHGAWANQLGYAAHKNKLKKTVWPHHVQADKYWSSRRCTMEDVFVVLLLIGLCVFIILFVMYYNKFQSNSSNNSSPGPGGNWGLLPPPLSATQIIGNIAVTPLSYNRSWLNYDGSGASPYLAPLLGWNSRQAFHYNLNEPQYRSELLALQASGLQGAGYNLAVIDDGWMCASSTTDATHQPITAVDIHGFPLPDPIKFSSSISQNGTTQLGFAPLAAYAHSLGFQFGLQIIGGLSLKAYNLNYTIPGTSQTTQTIIQGTNYSCPSTPAPYTFYYLDPTNVASQLWLNMMFGQLASWGVDYIKVDCLFGVDFNVTTNIPLIAEMYRSAALHSGRNIALTLGPGSSLEYTTNTITQIQFASFVANTYRVTVGAWPQENLTVGGVTQTYTTPSYSETTDQNGWSMVWVLSTYMPISLAFSGHVMTGSYDLSFPDYDVIAAGGVVLTNGNFYAPAGPSAFTYPQQQTIFSAWAMARSPILLGGDIRTPDYYSLAIATNPYMLFVNQYSGNATVLSTNNGNVVIMAERVDMGYTWILTTNMINASIAATVSVSTISMSRCDVYDIWGEVTSSQVSSVTSAVPPYGCLFARLSNCS